MELSYEETMRRIDEYEKEYADEGLNHKLCRKVSFPYHVDLYKGENQIIIVPLIIYGGKPFQIGVGILSVLGLKELIDLKKHHKKYPDLMIIFSYICLLLLVYSEFDGYSIAFGLTYRGIALTLLALLIPTVLYKKDKYTTKDAFYLITSVLFLGLVFNFRILVFL